MCVTTFSLKTPCAVQGKPSNKVQHVSVLFEQKQPPCGYFILNISPYHSGDFILNQALAQTGAAPYPEWFNIGVIVI